MQNSSELCKTCEVRHSHRVLLHIPAAELMLFGTDDDDEGVLQPLNLGSMLDERNQQQQQPAVAACCLVRRRPLDGCLSMC